MESKLSHSLLLFSLVYGNSVNVYVPVARSNMLFRDGNVDISIQRVDELHLHQEQGEFNGIAIDAWKSSKLGHSIAVLPAGNESKVPAKPESYEGAEIPVPDMHDGLDMFDSSVSLAEGSWGLQALLRNSAKGEEGSSR